MKKFTDLTEQDNIETISSILKSEVEKTKIQYEEIKKDGIIDQDELDVIIKTMQDLEFKARTLKEKMTNQIEINTMEEIINIVNQEQMKMSTSKMMSVNQMSYNVNLSK